MGRGRAALHAALQGLSTWNRASDQALMRSLEQLKERVSKEAASDLLPMVRPWVS